MRFITRDTDYALRALLFMAKEVKKNKAKIIDVKKIVAREKLPAALLRRILQKLANNKILKSYKGKGGGFSFLKSPDRITAVEIINIFQGDLDLTHCFLGTKICPNRAKCSLRKKIKNINSVVNKEFNKITISSLL
jgi:Rrf2 family protein